MLKSSNVADTRAISQPNHLEQEDGQPSSADPASLAPAPEPQAIAPAAAQQDELALLSPKELRTRAATLGK